MIIFIDHHRLVIIMSFLVRVIHVLNIELADSPQEFKKTNLYESSNRTACKFQSEILPWKRASRSILNLLMTSEGGHAWSTTLHTTVEDLKIEHKYCPGASNIAHLSLSPSPPLNFMTSNYSVGCFPRMQFMTPINHRKHGAIFLVLQHACSFITRFPLVPLIWTVFVGAMHGH